MRQIYLIIFLCIYVLYSFNILGANKSKLPSFIIAKTGNLPLDKILAAHQRELDENAKITTSFNQMALWETEGKSFLLKLLWSLGYYSATIDIKHPEKSDRPTIIFQITPAKQYTIRRISIELLEPTAKQAAKLHLPPLTWLTLTADMPVVAAQVLAEQKRLYDFIENNNCLLNLEVNHQVTIDHILHVVDLAFTIKASSTAAYISKLSFDGLQKVNAEYMHKIISVKEHSCFRRSIVNDYRVAIQKSGLFTMVEPVVTPVVGSDAAVNITFKVKERAHRTVKAGTSYSTDLGVGINAGWEHRNFFGQGEKVNSMLSLTKVEKKLDTQFEKPFFLIDNQTLKINTLLEQQNNKAYTSQGVSLAVLLERKISSHWTAGTGGKYGFSRIKEEAKKDFALFSIPTHLAYDTRDNILDPKSGIVVKGEASPFIDTISFNNKFLKTAIIGSGYLPIKTVLEPVLALRAVVGSTFGIATPKMPATERFYTGGASSIRGYGYKLAGPLNQKNDPIGGRSMIETSAELRLRLNKDFGLVAFIDSGNVFDLAYPKFGGKLYVGTGLGLRYYTGFGPLRLDVAMPLNKRRKIDSAFHLYFSIGQAF
ncbi:Translocation and assembly module TamA [Candidatus Trichorickettsia mobilis]|uniref:Translocation and assembly module TamA n=1 Tax=Candidatus Trichorickettsia mobilis TaxID=1346319 RepID=A0ABZ0UUY2_9RICK|nr:BamA/TamA family outer membrane protein [Candidatus Trichorickettsia mobilis]WPY00985.1 Translocation and assembly module TamA [Candidatus Trichorickettsia mobilis]